MSVVIPCNDDTHLPAMLASLAAQKHAPPFEVIVVDDSEQHPAQLVERWRHRLELLVVGARHGATSGANRNAGVAAARGELVLFVDADDTVNEEYIRAMAEALQAHRFVCSRVDIVSLNPWNPGGTHPQQTGLITEEMSFLPFAGAGTLGIRRSLYDEIGGWDPFLRFYPEADFCWRLQLAGHEPPAFVPNATLHYRLDPTLRGRWRRVVGLGRTQPLLYKRFGQAGMPREPLLRVVRAWSALVWGLLRRASGQPIAGLGWQAAIRVGRLQGSLRYRVAYF